MPSLPAPTDAEPVLSRRRESLLRELFWSTSPNGELEPGPSRFGSGAYTAPERSRWIAQRRLLSAFRYEAPDAYAEILALVRAWFASEAGRTWVERASTEGTWDGELESMAPLVGKIGLWGAARNLPPQSAGHFLFMLFVDAVLDVLAETFAAVTGGELPEQSYAEGRVHLYTVFGLFRRAAADAAEVRTVPELADVPLSFAFPAWDPDTCERQAYAEAARLAFERTLARHLEGQDAKCQAAGAVPTRVKRRAHTHFRWYIRYQALNESLATIAKAEYATEGAVWHAIGEVVELTGMPRRPGAKGGYPKGKPRSKRQTL